VRSEYVNHVPTLTGGRGKDPLREFYSRHFIPKMPPDMTIVPISRTIGTDQLVDEMICQFTHTVEMDWMLPGIAPTGKRVQVPLVAIVRFQGEKLVHEHICWDQATVLVQLELLDPDGLPVAGAETAQQVRHPGLPANALIEFPGSVPRDRCSDKKGGAMKHAGNKTMKLSMRISLAVAAALLATHVSTERAVASVQDLTTTSVRRLNRQEIQVSGTVTYSAGDVKPTLVGQLRRKGKKELLVYAVMKLPDVPGNPSVDSPVTYPWALTFFNYEGWKSGTATLSLDALWWDDTRQDYSSVNRTATISLPK
jgi:carboxymethylenebutenolidase